MAVCEDRTRSTPELHGNVHNVVATEDFERWATLRVAKTRASPRAVLVVEINYVMIIKTSCTLSVKKYSTIPAHTRTRARIHVYVTNYAWSAVLRPVSRQQVSPTKRVLGEKMMTPRLPWPISDLVPHLNQNWRFVQEGSIEKCTSPSNVASLLRAENYTLPQLRPHCHGCISQGI